jgi:hypothetical protein
VTDVCFHPVIASELLLFPLLTPKCGERKDKDISRKTFSIVWDWPAQPLRRWLMLPSTQNVLESNLVFLRRLRHHPEISKI